MEEKFGVIESVTKTAGSSPKGAWERWAFKIDGKTYSTFNADIGNKFQIGEKVKMTGEQSGQYWNMKTMVKCEDQSKEEVPAESTNEVVDLLRQILAELKSHGN